MRLDWLELRAPPLALSAGAAIVVVALAHVEGRVGRPSLDFTTVVGAALALAGVIIAVAGVAAFRRAHTTVDPLNPERSARLVTSGVYRWTRNPMYLGFVLLLVGMAVALQTLAGLAVAAALAACLQRFQIQPEERQLQALFPADFGAYRAKVRRWL